MAIKPGRSSQPDKKVGFGGSGGSWNSLFEADRYWIGVDFMVIKKKRIFFVIVKRKDTNTRMN